MTFDPGQLRESIDAAVRIYKSGEAGLYRRQGVPMFAEEEMAERRGRLEAALGVAVEKVEHAVEEELKALDRLEDARGADPLEHLGPADLARASTMQTFIKEDAYGLMPVEIQRRLKALLATEGSAFDKGVGALWLRYLRQRLGGIDGARPIVSGDDRLMLDELLGELGRRVAPAAGLSPAEAARRRQVARDVRFYAWRQARKATKADERLAAEMAASGRYRL